MRAQAKAKRTNWSNPAENPAAFCRTGAYPVAGSGSAAQDGKLGSFGRGMMVKPFEGCGLQHEAE